MHEDFPNGLAYDLSVLDRPLSADELNGLVTHATDTAGDRNAIRAVRQIVIESGW
jgi:hypothetical protein